MADFSSPPCDQYTSFQSTSLHITNRLFVDRNESASVATLVNADLRAPYQQFWVFKGIELFGAIKRLGATISQGAARDIWASIHSQDALFEDAWLHINLVLPPDEFKEIFHPIWIRQASSQLRLSLSMVGHHIPIEAAFSEIGDETNSAFEAEKRLAAKLESLEITTSLAETPLVQPQ